MYPNQFYSYGNYPSMYNMSNMYNAYGGMRGTSALSNTTKVGLLSKLKTGINWNGLLNNTSRTLNIVNQAIPLVNQVKPLVGNMRTMFKIANIMRDDDNVSKNTNQDINKIKKEENYDNQPTFFL